ncbi:HNH endonuclease signature motif containing protein [Haloarcula sebkhae]|uniref:HNH endonuclease signature motif containing protein n=2 Tax=Haloarcula sebkhae TaxID=932660 RepID=A0ACC6VNZ1_9EURY|nr:HNH endonuclease [Haloarcula sebkhae]GGK83058.1 hypothetical protein GCM10009067_39070 [Haloarcula sebkhae]
MKEGIESQYDDPDSYRGDYPPDWPYRLVFRKQLDNNTCANCEMQYPSEGLEVLRRIPAENGGTNKTTNLLTVCSTCEDDVKQEGRLNLPQSLTQEPAGGSEEDTHRVLPLQSDVPRTEETETDVTEQAGQSRGSSRLEVNHIPRSTRTPTDRPTTEGSDEQSDQGGTADERAISSRVLFASIGGTAMVLAYLCAIAVASFLPPLVSDVAFYGLPLAGLVTGVRWRLSTAVASAYVVSMYAALWQVFSAEPSVPAWVPVIAPLAGIAYGLVVERTGFSLRNHFRSQIRD